MAAASAIPLGRGPAPSDARGFNRAIAWSFGVHVIVVLFVTFAPRDWFVRPHAPEHLMTISLGGTVGPRTTGTTSLGGRTVEQVAPPPKREQPVRPTPQEQAPPAVVRTPPPATKPAAPPKPVPPPTRPPVTGRQITQGNTAADTGATGIGVGLTTGGGGGGGEADLKDFCCPDYLQTLKATITNNWQKNQPEQGLTILKFTIQRSGAITDIVVEQSSGSGLLDRIAKSAVLQSQNQLPPLPAAFTPGTLIIHLRFPFNGTQ
jgi:TonB family protein